jgi:hypothetical protein
MDDTGSTELKDCFGRVASRAWAQHASCCHTQTLSMCRSFIFLGLFSISNSDPLEAIAHQGPDRNLVRLASFRAARDSTCRASKGRFLIFGPLQGPPAHHLCKFNNSHGRRLNSPDQHKTPCWRAGSFPPSTFQLVLILHGP